MYAVLDISLNKLEQKSFYSFVTLYIVSSFLFTLLSGFWYYTAQKSSLESNDYFQMRHISDRVSSAVIKAHMKKTELKLPKIDAIYHVTLIDGSGHTFYGSPIKDFSVDKNRYFKFGNHTVLISDTAHGHLNIAYVVVQSHQLTHLLQTLKSTVIGMMALIAAIIMLISWILSKLFMRPIREKIDQVETFIKDVTHELNTPITALIMSTERAMKKERFDAKILRNISISTKQLFDIYTALTYLNFSHEEQSNEQCDLETVLRKSVGYYKELCDSKKIQIHCESESSVFSIGEHSANMLFSNLISNAVKYSMPNSKISTTLKEGIFTIEDHGIGIDKDKLETIFERYHRGTEYAGGFGIGLSIVKNICDEHNIGIEVTSEKDVGTRFVLDFTKGQL